MRWLEIEAAYKASVVSDFSTLKLDLPQVSSDLVSMDVDAQSGVLRGLNECGINEVTEKEAKDVTLS